jgi:hypothetical protein
MGKSTNDQSKKSSPKISEASRNAISSPASECGVTLCASPDGPMIGLFGQAVVLAPVSQRPDKGKALMTLVTSGLLGRDSSTSASLQRSLENRLMTRLATGGSTLFKLTWRGRTTPLGRRYLEHAVSVPRKSQADFTSWPRPQAHDDKKRGNTEADNHSFPHDLSNAAELASWPRPSANEYEQKDQEALNRRHQECKDRTGNGNGFGMTLGNVSRLAAWPRPMAGSPATETYNEAGNTDSSRKTVELVGWARPSDRDHKGGYHEGRTRSPEMEKAGRTLDVQAQLAASGPTPNGSTAQTENIGQLNPAHFRWLMGLPTAWDSCGAMVTRLSRRKRKRS